MSVTYLEAIRAELPENGVFVDEFTQVGYVSRLAYPVYGPRTYLGLAVHGLPNMFTISGPGSPSVLTNMITSIEQHVGWIRDCLVALRERGVHRIEATEQAQDEWVDYVNMVASMTLFPSCNSWYLGANVEGKTRVFMPLPGFAPYAQQCADVVADGYRGFALT